MKDLKKNIKTIIKEIFNENIKNYDIVYRGQPIDVNDISPKNYIWVTYDYDFAKEYGDVKEYKLPKNLNILDVDYYDKWESLVDDFDENGDYDEYKYEPTDEFIHFLSSKGYDGFMNGDNILIFNKKKLKKYLNEALTQSIFLSKNSKYGSYEGVVHFDIEKVKNWFLKRGMDYNKYIGYIEFPVAFLNNININLRYRGKGYGNDLYSDFEQECYYNDVKCIFLESDSDELQKKGFNLDKWYESLDFEVVGNEGGNSIMIKNL